MPLNSGDLDRRITIERRTTTRDQFNSEILTWEPLATVWASWRSATARERLSSQEVAADVEDVFEIRWSTVTSTVNPKDRLRFGGRIYDIVEATEIGRREGIRIKAAARSDNGES